MAVDQLPGKVREFANYLDGLLARLDQRGGWCAVFWQRDPDGMRACLDGREIPPWDVVEALLQDLAAAYGPDTAGAERERARHLYGAALAAYDARPGARDALGDRLDVMLREQRYAAERQGELGRLLAAAGTLEAAHALRLDLAWARDDHQRATARCAELRLRIAELDRRDADDRARDAHPTDGFPPGARTGTGPWSDRPTPAHPAGGPTAAVHPAPDPTRARPADDAGRLAGAPTEDRRPGDGAAPAAPGGEGGVGPGGVVGPGGFGAGGGAGPGAVGAGGGVGPGGAVGARGAVGAMDGAAPAAPGAVGRGGARSGGAVGSGGFGAGAGAVGAGGGAVGGPGAVGAGGAVAPVGGGPRASGPGHPARPAVHGAPDAVPGDASGRTAPDGPARGDDHPADGHGALGAAAAAAAGPRPSLDGKQRKRRRGGARFAGMAEDDVGPDPVPPSGPVLPAAAPAGRRTPRGARFAGAAGAVEPPEPRVQPADAQAAPAVAGAVRALERLRREGRTGEAHALLVEAAHWPPARLPLLAAELRRTGHGADWATLLWEAASLPADRLVAAADALVAAGRTADGEQILRQGVVRPAEEIGAAVLGLASEGRIREVRALLDAYVRVRTPEEAARSAAADPQRLVPHLLEAARGVSQERHWDLVHALRVAGFSA
ncbi:hypothetical protein [Streptomyces sp. NPDC004629]|uniref:hypothetical protein n=1 Tax=Streptomyces sp. NPDC004629 TaxID=3364705 RepID=UPI0036815EFE